MRDDGMTTGKRRGDQPVIGDLQKGTDRCRLIALLRYPRAYPCSRGQGGRVRHHEEPRVQLRSPRRKLVLPSLELVADMLDAQDLRGGMLTNDPVPEGPTKIKAVMQILGLDEDAGIDQVGHQVGNPNVRPSSLKVVVLEIPSI